MREKYLCPTMDTTCPYLNLTFGSCALVEPWEDCDDYAVYYPEDEEE